MSDLQRSLMRSAVPILAGLGTSLLASVGIKSGAVVSAIGAIIAVLYSSLVRWAEQKNPKWGKLLGSVGAPTYPAK